MKKYIFAAFYILASMPASARPPENVVISPELSEWYRSLMRPDFPGHCCDLSDCRPVEARVKDGHFEFFVDPNVFSNGTGEWVAVPPEKILTRENPTGGPVACWMKYMGVLCFVPGFDT